MLWAVKYFPKDVLRIHVIGSIPELCSVNPRRLSVCLQLCVPAHTVLPVEATGQDWAASSSALLLPYLSSCLFGFGGSGTQPRALYLEGKSTELYSQPLFCFIF